MAADVQILESSILSDNWYILKKITYSFTDTDGSRKTHVREAYDRGNGAAILLYQRTGNRYPDKTVPAAHIH